MSFTTSIFTNIFTTRAIAGLIFWAIGLLILVSLWQWQLDRLIWKQNLLNKLEIEETRPEQDQVSLDLLKSSAAEELFLKKFTALSSEATVNTDKLVFVGPRPKDDVPGFHLYAPLPLAEDNITLIAHLGWLPEYLKSDIEDALAQTNWPQDILGYFVMQDPSPIIQVKNFPDEEIWLRADIKDLSAYFGVQPTSTTDLDLFTEKPPTAPAFFYVENIMAEGLEPFFYKDISFVNNHAQYARFWLLMSFAWTFIFLMAAVWPAVKDNIPFLSDRDKS